MTSVKPKYQVGDVVFIHPGNCDKHYMYTHTLDKVCYGTIVDIKNRLSANNCHYIVRRHDKPYGQNYIRKKLEIYGYFHTISSILK